MKLLLERLVIPMLVCQLKPIGYFTQPVSEEPGSTLLPSKDASHRRALIALVLFFPTGIFALFYSIQVMQ